MRGACGAVLPSRKKVVDYNGSRYIHYGYNRMRYASAIPEDFPRLLLRLILMDDLNKSLHRATRIYEALMRLYPRGHREEYGPLMVQLFRDQFREIGRTGNRRTWLRFWLCAFFDVTRSAFLEQLSHTTHRMKNALAQNSESSQTPRERRNRNLLAALTGLGGLMAVAWLCNMYPPVPVGLRERMMGAAACFLVPVIVWQWRYSYRLLPVLSGARTRLAAWVLGSVVGTLCTVALMQLIPEAESDAFTCLATGAAMGAFLPMALGFSSLFGLNEAAARLES